MGKNKVREALNVIAWDEEFGYYFSIEYNGDVLMGSLDYQETDFEAPDTAHLEKIVKNLKECDDKAHKLIQSNFPEEDASELDLSDMTISSDGSFLLGYDAGGTETEASGEGQLYLYVRFGSDFVADEELLYEIY